MTRLLFAIVAVLLLGSISVAQDGKRKEPPEKATTAAPEARRAVLVTGASTGIGRKTAEVLAANGFFVYACARKDADLKALNAIEHVQAIRLDVTKPEEIAAAVKTVRDAGTRAVWPCEQRRCRRGRSAHRDARRRSRVSV